MRVGILAEKIGMSRFYDDKSINHPVTLLKVTNSKVVGIQNEEKNGYKSITVSHGSCKNQNKAFKQFTKKNKLAPFFKSKEFRVESLDNFKIGDEVGVKNFMEGQFIDVSANSIGKGFAGGMKRHNFAGNRATHGVSISHRSHGSTGQCQDPGKVFKGKKMAGRLGNKKTTIQNLQILKIDTDNNLLVVKGAVPGHKGCIVKVVDSVKKNQDIKIASETKSANEEPPKVEIQAEDTNLISEQKEAENKIENKSEKQQQALQEKVEDTPKENKLAEASESKKIPNPSNDDGGSVNDNEKPEGDQ